MMGVSTFRDGSTFARTFYIFHVIMINDLYCFNTDEGGAISLSCLA
jgi:hypothetical protein